MGTFRADRPAGAVLPAANRSAIWTCTSCTTAGRPVVRAGDVAAAGRADVPDPTRQLEDGRISRTDLLKILVLLQRLQQGMDHPPVRSRSAGRHSDQAAGRRPRRWPRRCGGHHAGAGLLDGMAVGCGINPRYGDLDPYWMAAAAIDEAVRNVVAVGADPARIALLDNFCWGNTDRPEVLGSLVRAAEACRDVALAFSMPFISGKDSLNNEYTSAGRHIVIPPTLLISALGRVPDVRRCVTMDLKEPGNRALPDRRRPATKWAARIFTWSAA